MQKNLSTNNVARRGFTLIEILIVVAIIAILASMVLVGIGPTQQLARDARRVSDLHSIQTALELYYARNGNYPDSLDTLGSSGVVGSVAIPNDPSSPHNPYIYTQQNGGQSYLLQAELENKNGSAFQAYTPPTGCPTNTIADSNGRYPYCLTL